MLFFFAAFKPGGALHEMFPLQQAEFVSFQIPIRTLVLIREMYFKRL